jgi:CRISPR-associated endonuclease/helicase Cas3
LLEINGQTYRHEFGSLRDAENDPNIGELSEELRELALHLVVAHHGFARPVIAAVDPENAPSASAELAREVAQRFARLQARWGPWGLAWWEALLRAADWAASRKLNENAAGAEVA